MPGGTPVSWPDRSTLVEQMRRQYRSRRARLAVTAAAIGVAALVAGVVLHGAKAVNEGAPAVDRGIWISLDEVRQLPKSGSAWRRLKQAADAGLGDADIADQNSSHDVKTLAVALVFARTGKESYRAKAVDAIMDAIGTEDGGRTLALGRNLVAYVIAADLVNLRAYAPSDQKRFAKWLREVRKERFEGRTLVSTHEQRPNNWGTMAGASRAAIAAYLGERAELDRVAKVFKGWLGDRSSYDGFVYGEVEWQANPDEPVGVNPVGARRNGFSIDGALPPEMRRGGKFRVPPKRTDYPWGGLGGAVVTAELLSRQGYDAWRWEDQALRRAVQFLYDLDRAYGKWWADGDDTWLPWLVNARYGTSFPTAPAVFPGKNMAWTDWTHAG